MGVPTNTSKLHLLPLSKHTVMLRLVNVADKFDATPSVAYVKVDQLAVLLYQSVNGGVKPE